MCRSGDADAIYVEQEFFARKCFEAQGILNSGIYCSCFRSLRHILSLLNVAPTVHLSVMSACAQQGRCSSRDNKWPITTGKNESPLLTSACAWMSIDEY